MNSSLPVHHHHHVNPNHVILNITPEPKFTKILHYRQNKSIDQTIKEAPPIVQSLSLNNTTQDPLTFQVSAFIAKVKKIKSLKSLNIDLEWLSYIHHKTAHKLFEAVKHLKNPPKLNFDINKSHVIFLKSRILCLWQSLKLLQYFPEMQIKLSLKIVGLGKNENAKRLLETFSRLKGFISANLTFLYFTDISEIQELITTLKTSKSLSKLYMTLDLSTIDPHIKLQNLLECLAGIESLRDTRVYIKKCHTITYSGLQGLLSPLKEIAQKFNLEIVFDDCLNSITVIEWWSFVKALKKLSHPHTIRAKFIGNKGRVPPFLVCAIFLLVIVFVVMFPIILTLSTGAN